ncbi:MAG: DnaJ C-terminal domain-containing protein [Cyanobacteria bacterium P01_F01_bin.150]
MKDFRDYYGSLGVEQNATADELKTAYRRAARRYHPDLNPGDETAEEKFKEIGEAYEILSDSDRRSEYDQFTQFLEEQKNPSKGLFGLGKKSTKDYSQFKDFGMFVDYLLNRRGVSKSSSPSPSTTASASSTASPKSSTSTSTQKQTADSPPKTQSPTKSSAPNSSTSASASASTPTSASTSSPSTQSTAAKQPSTSSQTTASSSRQPNRQPNRQSSTTTPSQNRSSTQPTSNAFQGKQSVQNPKSKIQNPSTSQQRKRSIQNPKSKIQNVTEAQLTLPLNKAYKGGKERIRLADGRSLTVTLPPAMLSGQTIQITAHEPSGDRLSLLIQVTPHDFFTLDIPNIHCTIPITPSEAILGGPISIPTLDGSVKMVVPAGARSGQKLRLPGKGYPFAGQTSNQTDGQTNGQRGDQIVELEIQMPTTVTARERELYEKIRLTESFRPRKHLYF